MSKFRTRILSLAALAIGCAGASFGQYSITGTSAPFGAPNLRSEGTTELVGQANFSITPTAVANNNVTNATVTIFMSAPVTSTPAAGATAGNPIINAVLTCAGTAYNGTLDATGKQIVFTNVAITNSGAGPTFTATACTLTGVRVNASAVTVGATLTGVTASAAVTVNNVSAAQAIGTTVGYVFNTLAAPTVTNFTAAGATAPIAPIFTAPGNPAKASVAPSFYASVGENIAGAFKVCGTATTPNSENNNGNAGGSLGDAQAIFGTRIQLALGNVPSAATIWAPTTVTVVTTGGTWAFTLVSSPTAPDGAGCVVPAVAASTATTAPIFGGITVGAGAHTYAATASFTPSSNTVTLVYEVTAVPAGAAQKITAVEIPVALTLPTAAISTGTGAVTVLESYSPTAAAAAATTVPNFAVPTGTALNSVSILTSQTSLIFPYVTSAAGFDTGLAVANTTTDSFGTVATSGACTYNLYGSGQPTPNTGIAAGGTVTSGGVGTPFLLSTIANGFTGYMIVNCPFVDAYGFAYIFYDFGKTDAVTMGYVASQLNRSVGGATSIGQ